MCQMWLIHFPFWFSFFIGIQVDFASQIHSTNDDIVKRNKGIIYLKKKNAIEVENETNSCYYKLSKDLESELLLYKTVIINERIIGESKK